MFKSHRFIPAFIFLTFLVFASSASAHTGLRFKISVDPSAAASGGEPLSGRLLIFMTKSEKPLEMVEPNFTDPNAVWVSGIEVKNLEAGKNIEINADDLSFPGKFSEAPAGEYQIMALLDRDHSYTYNGTGAGDVYSVVSKLSLPAAGSEFVLSKTVPARTPPVHANARVIEFESPMLSAFWGRSIKMQATVVLPPSYDKSKSEKYPTVYSIHGYGGTHLGGLRGIDSFLKTMTDGKRPGMIHVFLNGNNSLGHHAFADSANNGPWGTALTAEFIPYLEKQFRMDAKPSGRFVTGHSSGGWSSLWVMITHPDFFAGTWSTSPDPTDFRNFTGPDLTLDPPQNAYLDKDGKDYNLVRMNGKNIMSLRQYAQQERVLGYYGGQFASFNAVFSPKGPDGQPMPLFDIETGRIDPFVAKAWEKYDISLVLRRNWKTLGSKLKGKLNIVVGTADTFHLDESLRLLDGELKKLGSDAKVEYIEGKTHFDLFQNGLGERMAWEMYRIARPNAKTATK